MFDVQAEAQQYDIEPDFTDAAPFDPKEVIRSYTELPIEVRTAEFTKIEERLIDECVLVRLTNQLSLESNAGDVVDRFKARLESLSPYLGLTLTCVFIRFPGVHYTIEIDPIAREVVHWEWQHY